MDMRQTIQAMMDTAWDLPIPIIVQGKPRPLSPEDEDYIRNYPEKTLLGLGENKGYPDLIDLEYMARFERMKRHYDQGFTSDAIAEGVDLVTKYPTWPRGLIRLAYAYRATNERPYLAVVKQLLDRTRSILEAHRRGNFPPHLQPPTVRTVEDQDLQVVLQSTCLNLGDYWVAQEDYAKALRDFDAGLAIDQPNYRIPLQVYKAYALARMGHFEEAHALYRKTLPLEGADAIASHFEHLYPELTLLREQGDPTK